MFFFNIILKNKFYKNLHQIELFFFYLYILLMHLNWQISILKKIKLFEYKSINIRDLFNYLSIFIRIKKVL